jgi:hypothetical protein
MSNSEPVIDTTEVDDSEQVEFLDSSGNVEEGVTDTTEEFWEAFEDEKAESLTTVWVCDVSFDVPERGRARDIFACTTKDKIVTRLFSIISSSDLKDPCEFDATKFTTKQQAIRAFFDGVEERNLFVGLVPVF